MEAKTIVLQFLGGEFEHPYLRARVETSLAVLNILGCQTCPQHSRSRVYSRISQSITCEPSYSSGGAWYRREAVRKIPLAHVQFSFCKRCIGEKKKLGRALLIAHLESRADRIEA